MKVLGIESSCDDTSAAVVVDGQHVLSNVVATQIPVHAKYGGVVPELASRNHVVDIIPVVEQALHDAALTLEEIDGIAVTQGPGLVGSLLVGIEVAKALAYRHRRPLVGVNHVEAHLLAAHVSHDPTFDPPTFPFIGLVVSGGHTSLVRVTGVNAYEILGQTLDDAAGEGLDKVGKMLGLGYPGGVHIDRLSDDGDEGAYTFPRALKRRGNYNFSFSGLKTSVRTFLERLDTTPDEAQRADICASVQEAVVDILVYKTMAAARAQGIDAVVLSGGVSANRRLRMRMRQATQEAGMRFSVPPRALCTDNAAMIAGLGYHHLVPLEGSEFNSFRLNARASWPIGG